METELSSIKFYGEKIESIDSSNSKDLSYGVKSVDDIPSKIERIGDLKSLCVWLQEEQKRVQALNIVIPNSLKAIYDEVSQFGK